MADIFGHTYLSRGSPDSIVAQYLSVFTQGEIEAPPGECEPLGVKNYDIRKAYMASSFKGYYNYDCIAVVVLVIVVVCIVFKGEICLPKYETG